MKVSKIFKDSGYPEYTYVERRKRGKSNSGTGNREGKLEEKKEETLADYLFKESALVSLSGPSKSGKSALINHVIEEYDRTPDRLVTVRGNNISSEDELWKAVLKKLDKPDKQTHEVKTGTKSTDKIGIGAAIQALTAKYTTSDTKEDFETIIKKYDLGLDDIIELHSKEPFVIFVDDAHKIPDKIHQPLAEKIKEGYDRGLTMCVGYIDYRADALVSADIDLSARVDSISLNQWAVEDLMKIAEQGFDELDIEVSDEVIRALATESIGSPQLMQKACYTFCTNKNIYTTSDGGRKLNVSREYVKLILRKVGSGLSTNFSTEMALLDGSIKGYQTKTKYDFIDGSQGDRYIAILRGIAANDPQTSFQLSELKERIRNQCSGKAPQGGNITQDVERMSSWIKNAEKAEDFIFEYSEEQAEQVQIPEPALLFFLRWSDALDYEPKINPSIHWN